MVAQRAALLERLVRRRHRLGRGVQTGERRHDEVVAEIVQLVGGEERRLARLDHVRHPHDAGNGRGHGLELLDRLGRLDEDGIRAEPCGHARSFARFVNAHRGARVGAGDQEELLSMVDDGSHLGQPLVAGNDALARHVPALLRPHLVFEEDPCRACALEQLDRADRVERVPVTRVGIDHHRGAGDSATHPPGDLGHLGLGEVAEVGEPQVGRGGGVAGDEDHLEAGVDGQSRRQGIPDARHQHGRPVLQQRAQPVPVHQGERTAASRNEPPGVERV